MVIPSEAMAPCDVHRALLRPQPLRTKASKAAARTAGRASPPSAGRAASQRTGDGVGGGGMASVCGHCSRKPGQPFASRTSRGVTIFTVLRGPLPHSPILLEDLVKSPERHGVKGVRSRVKGFFDSLGPGGPSLAQNDK
jgi:hypothetical protein